MKKSIIILTAAIFAFTASPAFAWDFSEKEVASLTNCLRDAGIKKGTVTLFSSAETKTGKPRFHFGGLKKGSQKGDAAMKCAKDTWTARNAAKKKGGRSL